MGRRQQRRRRRRRGRRRQPSQRGAHIENEADARRRDARRTLEKSSVPPALTRPRVKRRREGRKEEKGRDARGSLPRAENFCELTLSLHLPVQFYLSPFLSLFVFILPSPGNEKLKCRPEQRSRPSEARDAPRLERPFRVSRSAAVRSYGGLPGQTRRWDDEGTVLAELSRRATYAGDRRVIRACRRCAAVNQAEQFKVDVVLRAMYSW